MTTPICARCGATPERRATAGVEYLCHPESPEDPEHPDCYTFVTVGGEALPDGRVWQDGNWVTPEPEAGDGE